MKWVEGRMRPTPEKDELVVMEDKRGAGLRTWVCTNGDGPMPGPLGQV